MRSQKIVIQLPVYIVDRIGIKGVQIPEQTVLMNLNRWIKRKNFFYDVSAHYFVAEYYVGSHNPAVVEPVFFSLADVVVID